VQDGELRDAVDSHPQATLVDRRRSDALERPDAIENTLVEVRNVDVQRFAGLRRVAKAVDGVDGDELPAIDDRDAITDRLDLFHDVTREEDGRPALVLLADDLAHLAGSVRIEAGRGLVEDEQVGIADQRHG